MPQLVAFYNGVGGGTVALIALAEFLDTNGFSAFKHAEEPTAHIVIASLFSAIIGSISFWGSLVAFGKLQEILPQRPIGLPGKAQQVLNALLLLGAVVCAVVIGLGAHPGGGVPAVVDDRRAGCRGGAGADGGAADRRCRHASGDLAAERDDRIVRCRSGFGAEQHRDDRGRHDRRRVRLDPDQPDGQGDEPLHPGDRRRRFWRRRSGGRWRRGRRPHGQVHVRRRRRDPDGLRQPGDRRTRIRHGRRAGAARGQGHGRAARETRRAGQIRDPSRSRAACPAT